MNSYGDLKMETFIRKPAILDRTGSTSPSLYRWVNKGHFPAPVKIGPRAVAWRLSEVEEWEKDPTSWREAHTKNSC
jgi:prophage regulatory protein